MWLYSKDVLCSKLVCYKLALGIIGGIAAGWLMVALSDCLKRRIRKDVRDQVHAVMRTAVQKYKQVTQPQVIKEAQRVKGIPQPPAPIIVDLENCFTYEDSEAKQHDFKAELAAKGITKLDVELSLSIIDEKLKKVSTLFKQVHGKFEQASEAFKQSLNESFEFDKNEVLRLIQNIQETYQLSVSAYKFLVEIIEEFWDYFPIELRKYFKIKAEEVLNKKIKRVKPEEIPEKDETNEIDKIGIELVVWDEEGNAKTVTTTLTGEDKATIEERISGSIEPYNNYVDAALHFAYSVFGSIARDKNREELGGIDETSYLFELSEKNAARLRAAIKRTEGGQGKAMTLDELREELNISEKEEER